MEIYHIKAFVAVARLRHMTRAAEQLHLTQPALSKQIKAFEDELGVVLFERTPSGMNLTRAGALLLPQAEKTLADAMELISQAGNIRGKVSGTVRIGTIIDPDFLRLGAILEQLMQACPLVEVKLSHGISGMVLEELKSGAIDAGFYLGQIADVDISAIELCKLRYLVVAPAKWAEAIAHAGWAEIAAMPWIGTPRHSSQNRLVSEMFKERGLTFSTAIEADQEASMQSLVSMEVGLCLLRDDIALAAQGRGELVIWDKAECACPLSYIFLRSGAGTELQIQLQDVVRTVWQ